MKPVFLGIFDSKESVAAQFEENLPEDISIIFASYDYRDYSGSAHVVFEQGGELYEVYGSHCSCYGLEGQWNPEETSVDAIKMRNEPDQTELNRALDAWLAEHELSCRVIGEFDDTETMRLFGSLGHGLFPLHVALAGHAPIGDIVSVGAFDGVKESIYALSPQRRAHRQDVQKILAGGRSKASPTPTTPRPRL